MPVTKTITSYNVYTADSLIKSADVNSNFSNLRGHIIPIDGSAASSVDNAYDLGDSGYRWANVYGSNLRGAHLRNQTTVTASYSLTADDCVIYCATAATMTLPNVATYVNKELYFEKTDASTGAIAIGSVITLESPLDSASLVSDGSNWRIENSRKRPTIQKYTSGTGTYTPPAGVKFLRIRMAGGGGGSPSGTDGINAVGGAGSTTSPTLTTGMTGTGSPPGGNGGGATKFGDMYAGGGTGGGYTGSVSGGTASINGEDAVSVIVQSGGGSNGLSYWPTGKYTVGTPGGNTPFFGGGAQGSFTTGISGVTNTGGGGSAGGQTSGTANCYIDGGGSSGAYLEAFINKIAASYSYQIGAGGAGGTLGSGGAAGGAGASGILIIEEYF